MWRPTANRRTFALTLVTLLAGEERVGLWVMAIRVPCNQGVGIGAFD
jgi:hypothetical protein